MSPDDGPIATVGALQGIVVLDLSRVLAGPFCTQVLADLGATVWKIEPPWGDETRSWGPPFVDGESTYFLAANRGKRSLAIDLRKPDGAQIVRRLAARADVLVENFKSGNLARFGLGYSELARENPRLVYASVTGFGQTGPRAGEPGYDLVLQAMSGVMASTGDAGGEPVKVGVAVVDVMAGMIAISGILAALYERERSGLGQHVDIALFDVAAMAMVNVAQTYLSTGTVPPRSGSGHPQIVPYQAFATTDGWVVVAVGNDEQYRRMCTAVGATQLAADPRFVSNRERVENRGALVALLSAHLATRGTDEWVRVLTEAGVPCAPVAEVDRVFTDEQAVARGLTWEVDHTALGRIPVVADALRHMSRTPAMPSTAPPQLGEHTREVLATALDLTPDELDALESAGVTSSLATSPPGLVGST